MIFFSACKTFGGKGATEAIKGGSAPAAVPVSLMEIKNKIETILL
jgi:hypothetical protein